MAEMSQTSAEAEVSSQAKPSQDPRPVYEVGFHVVPTVGEEGIGAVMEKLRSELTKGNAELIAEQMPQKMTLAYVIERSDSSKHEKYAEAYFGWIKFATEKENISALETVLRAEKNILRYLLVETVREEAVARRAIFTSDRLEGETIKKPVSTPQEVKVPVSEEELEKSIEAITS